eukprot:1186265-Prorocentrum_minimum.AAC.3
MTPLSPTSVKPRSKCVRLVSELSERTPASSTCVADRSRLSSANRLRSEPSPSPRTCRCFSSQSRQGRGHILEAGANDGVRTGANLRGGPSHSWRIIRRGSRHLGLPQVQMLQTGEAGHPAQVADLRSSQPTQ